MWTLKRLLSKRRMVILGLNSGTSADSLDMAALRVDTAGPKLRYTFLDGRTRKLDSHLRQLILSIADSRNVDINELIHLDQALGIFMGRAASRFIHSLEKKSIRVDAVASHGQTIRHLPDRTTIGSFCVRGSLQTGSPEQIAVYTGKTVIGDLRQADIAAGGEGAPITVDAMCRLFGDKYQTRLIVNIGGMANYFLIPAGCNPLEVRAADTGPGNVVCDILCRRLFAELYDRNGRHALSGKVSERLLSLLLRNPFFTSGRRSTGREDFGPPLVEEMTSFARRFQLAPDDLLATAAELTVISIAEHVERLLAARNDIGKLYLTGGGVHNKFFLRRLKRMFPELSIRSVRELGIDPDLVEAAAFAVIGHAALQSRTSKTRCTDRTAPKIEPVLGRIAQPPQRKP